MRKYRNNYILYIYIFFLGGGGGEGRGVRVISKLPKFSN